MLLPRADLLKLVRVGQGNFKVWTVTLQSRYSLHISTRL